MLYSKEIPEVLCLRPKKDFEDVGVIPPENLQIHYKNLLEDANEIRDLKIRCKALVIPAVGDKIKSSFFTGTNIKMVQITVKSRSRWSKLKNNTFVTNYMCFTAQQNYT